jgi:hypothetical protein
MEPLTAMISWVRAVILVLPLSVGDAPARPEAAAVLAAPQIIVAGGGPLRHRVVLADWNENQRLMLATTGAVPIQVNSLRQRPRIRVAMYWGPQWMGRLDLPDSVTLLEESNGAQSGAFYPALRGRPAVWLFGSYGVTPASARHVAGEGLAILAKHGIPVAVE